MPENQDKHKAGSPEGSSVSGEQKAENADKKEAKVKFSSVSSRSDGRTVEGKKEKISKKEMKPLATQGNKKHILIAEDERPLAHALELKFAHEGYITSIAKDGSEAMKCVREGKPDIILLDLIMPKVDGFAFLEEMKKTGNRAPIIVLSNLGQEEDIERAKNLGVKAYFVKSNTPITDIVREVKKVL